MKEKNMIRGFSVEAEDIDAALDFLTGTGGEDSVEMRFHEGLFNEAQDELQDLFEHILVEYLEPVRNTLARVRDGHVTNAALEGLCGSLEPLLEGARQVSGAALVVGFEEMLDTARGMIAAEGHVTVADIQALLGTYDEVIDTLSLDDKERFRVRKHFQMSTIPLLDFLITIRGIGKRTIQRLYNAGIYDTNILEMSNAEEISSVTGVNIRICRLVYDSLGSFKKQYLSQRLAVISESVERLEFALSTFTDDEEMEALRAASKQLDGLRLTLADKLAELPS